MSKNLEALIENYKSITINNSHFSNDIQEILKRGIAFQYVQNERDEDILYLSADSLLGKAS